MSDVYSVIRHSNGQIMYSDHKPMELNAIPVIRSQDAFASPFRWSEMRRISAEDCGWIFNELGKANMRKRFDKIRAEQIAKSIRDGMWQLTHQGIAFLESGLLADGHHRTYAGWVSGIGITTEVTYGLTIRQAQELDGIVARSAADIAYSKGKEYNKDHFAIARCVLQEGEVKKAVKAPYYLLEEFLDKHHEAISWAMGLCGHHNLLRRAPCATTIFRSWYTSPIDRVEEFCNVVKSGVVRDNGDVAAARFVSATTGIKCGGGTPRKHLYRLTQSALIHFIKRNPIAKLYGTESEQFPIPE